MSQPATQEKKSGSRGRIRVETGTKRIRAFLGGIAVADTSSPLLVWEKPYYPAYYFPVADVRTELLEPDHGVVHSPSRGDARPFTVRAGGLEVPHAALRYYDSPLAELRDTIRFEWDAMESWFEEDEEVFTHPRDPYTRVDIVPSSRHVRIEVDGVTVAESMSPRLLFETGLPVRYYLPKTHVRMDLCGRPTRSATAPTRATPNGGRSGSTTRPTPTSPGPTACPCPRARRSPASSPSTTRRSTSTSTASLQERPRTKFS